MRPVSSHSSPIYDRSYLLATLAVAYVALASLQQTGGGALPVLVLLGAPAALYGVWRSTGRAALRSGPAEQQPPALDALRACSWGACVWLAARVGPVGRPAFDLAANIGLGTATVAASIAIARIPHAGGLVSPSRSSRSLDGAVFCALLWGIAAALPGARALLPARNLLLDPLATDYATTAASIASVLVLIAAALRVRALRRLELGVPDRASGALALSLTAFSVAVPAALAGLAAHDRALPMGALGAALACAWAATTPEPTDVSSSLRGALVVTVLGVPVALTTALVAENLPSRVGVVVLAGCAATLAVGLLARAVARPLAPEQSRWLDALDAASRAALEPEPHLAIVATLESLQRLEPTVRTRPELWRRDPPEVLSVDLAGYLHSEAAVAPAEVYELAAAEPERLLRRDVLASLEVRRPDARAALGWMDARAAFGVTLVCEEGVPLGLLALPRGTRTRPATLEEARAARQLADRLSAILALSGALSRARQREQESAQRLIGGAQRIEELERALAQRARPRDQVIDALASRVRVAAFSARAQLALERLARTAAAGGDLGLQAPVGVDALAWACAFHLASPRRDGPLIVTDGAGSAAASSAYWTDPALAPTRRASGGTLCILHVEALPIETQDALAIELARRTEPGPEAPQVSLLVSSAEPLPELLEKRQLSRALAQLLPADSLALPALVDRPEDLRGLVLDQLCRSGVRRAGAPLGIEPRALELLIDHTWPGNDAELALVMERAARAASGDRISAADLEAIGFSPVLDPDVEEAEAPDAELTRSARARSERVRVARAELGGDSASRPVQRRRRRR